MRQRTAGPCSAEVAIGLGDDQRFFFLLCFGIASEGVVCEDIGVLAQLEWRQLMQIILGMSSYCDCDSFGGGGQSIVGSIILGF